MNVCLCTTYFIDYCAVILELEMLESRLVMVEEEAASYKKAARLWKARYLQERKAR